MDDLPVSVQVLDDLTNQLITALTRRGFCARRGDGTLQEVRVKDRRVVRSGSMLLVEIDTGRLPHGVHTEKLLEEGVLHDLTASLHTYVQKLNTVGVTYVIHLSGHKPAMGEARLPMQVPLSDVLADRPANDPYAYPVGLGPTGPVWASLRSGHVLVGGLTDSGKSTWLRAVLFTLFQATTPQQLQAVLVDPKVVDFARFSPFPHLVRPIATDAEEAEAAVNWLLEEVARRQVAFLSADATSLEEYNAHVPGKPLPRLLVVIDEFTDLMTAAGGPRSGLSRGLMRLTTKARALGVTFIFATHTPKAELLSTLIRNNLAVRICFRVLEMAHSRMVVLSPGAEKIPGAAKGRMLARLSDGRPRVLQGYFVGNDSVLYVGNGSKPIASLDRTTLCVLQYGSAVLGGRFPQKEVMEGCKVSLSQYQRARDSLAALGLIAQNPQAGNRWEVCAERVAALGGLDGHN